MNREQEILVRHNAFGEVDVDYYIAQANAQRCEVFAKALQKLGSLFVNLLGFSMSRRPVAVVQPSSC